MNRAGFLGMLAAVPVMGAAVVRSREAEATNVNEALNQTYQRDNAFRPLVIAPFTRSSEWRRTGEVFDEPAGFEWRLYYVGGEDRYGGPFYTDRVFLTDADVEANATPDQLVDCIEAQLDICKFLLRDWIARGMPFEGRVR